MGRGNISMIQLKSRAVLAKEYSEQIAHFGHRKTTAISNNFCARYCYSLHSKIVPRSFCKRDNIAMHTWCDVFPEPSLWAELEGFGKYLGISMLHVRRHTNRRLQTF